MPPDRSVPRRLPGVRFEVPPPAPDEALPRMDIAFFVGFADRGPLDRAMAVESLAGFEALYGSGLVLARDGSTGEAVRGLLHPCVRSFFSQGGRRCWILRVAGEGVRTGIFPVPGLLQAQRRDGIWHARAATLQASSPGSGADALRLAARVAVRLLRVAPLSLEEGTLRLQASVAAAQALRAGDLLRIRVGGLEVHGRLATIEDGGAQRTLVLGTLLALRRPQASPALVLERIEACGDADHSPPGVAATGEWTDAGLQVRCRLAPPWPQVGEVLRLSFSGEERPAWMAVAAADLLEPAGPGGLPLLQLRGQPWIEDDATAELAAWLAEGSTRVVQRLRLGLQARDGQSEPVLAEDLPLSAGAGEIAVGLGDPFAFAVRGEAATHEQLWVPLAELAGFGEGLPPRATNATPLQRDGLAQFSWDLFVEPSLADLPAQALPDQAEALRLAGPRLRPLRGLHALFGGVAEDLVHEPTLLAVPDAVQPGWSPAPAVPAWTDLPALPEPADPCAGEPFRDCDALPLPAPVFVQGADPDADGRLTLYWTQVLPQAAYTLEEAGDAGFLAASTVYQGGLARFDAPPRAAGAVFYRVRAQAGARRSAWSARVRIEIGRSGYLARAWQPAQLLELHRQMLRCAAGRGDLLAVLALPEHYDTAAAASHADALRRHVADPRTLSHGALYHPWLVIRRVDEVLRFPPDGAACGQLAAEALARGAWIAVANRPLRDVVALTPPGLQPALAQRQQLLDAQVNLVRSAPHGFVFSSADTLTPEAEWRPVNVRRLMALLRRLALRRGTAYVFEPNGPTLRRTVERGFSAVLGDLYRRGALAGARPADAYRVEAGDEVNTPQRNDAGQFWVQLKVAPALPLEFLTVRLAREGERVVSRELH